MRSYIFLSVLALVFVFGPVESFSQETNETKEQLAERYYELNPTWRTVSNSIREQARSMPEKQRLVFVTAMEKSIDKEAIKQEALSLIIELFSEEELKKLISYYEDPLVQSAQVKEETLERRLGPTVTKMLDEALITIRTQQSR